MGKRVFGSRYSVLGIPSIGRNDYGDSRSFSFFLPTTDYRLLAHWWFWLGRQCLMQFGSGFSDVAEQFGEYLLGFGEVPF